MFQHVLRGGCCAKANNAQIARHKVTYIPRSRDITSRHCNLTKVCRISTMDIGNLQINISKIDFFYGLVK